MAFTLAVLGWVVARQTASVIAATELAGLRDERRALESARSEAERRIREAENPTVLFPKAEHMGLEVPADSQWTRLQAEGRTP